MLKLFKIFQYPKLSGIFIPFKVYIRSKINIRSSADVILGSRVIIGNPDKKAARVSVIPVNIYFGYKSKILLGKSISIGPGVNIIVKNNAQLSIGDSTYFTSDMHIEVLNKITIGKNCAISWGVTIIDDDHHKLISEKNTDTPSQVIIGDHVWVGCNSTILKGSVIGNNCVIGANSLVKGTFPDNCLIAGNPAKIVKNNINWQ